MTNMLEALKFVMGGVSKKDMVPEMKHFAIEKGRVRSHNGMLALCSPIPFDIDCYPKADLLIKAIANCEETVQLSMTPAGKLRVVSGPFKALVSCIENSHVHLEPSGEMVQVDGEELFRAFKVLEPFIGDDASRPWANGILLDGQSAFATCNIVLAEYWLGFIVPKKVNIPAVAIREVVRVGRAPSHLQMDENSVTFHYDDGCWIRTQLFSTEWPDLSKVLNRSCNATPVDTRIFDALKKIKNFVDKTGLVVFTANKVSTSFKEEDEGAEIDLPSSTMLGAYTREMLLLLQGVAEQADFTTYPAPCMFFGGRVRGAIVGRRS